MIVGFGGLGAQTFGGNTAALQARLNTWIASGTPYRLSLLVVDGKWGPKTQAALDAAVPGWRLMSDEAILAAIPGPAPGSSGPGVPPRVSSAWYMQPKAWGLALLGAGALVYATRRRR